MTNKSFIGLDVGNSAIKVGLFQTENDKFFYIDKNNLLNFQIDISNYDFCLVSSVNDLNYGIFKKNCFYTFQGKIFSIDHTFPFSFEIKIEHPEKIGADRLCLIEGSLYFARLKKLSFDYLISIDFGTATTINVLNQKKEFIGGLIMPGLKTMIKSLHTDTAKLPDISLDNYDGIIGNETKKAIASGALNYLKKSFNANHLLIFATGGNYKSIMNFLEFDKIIYYENLNLYGIKSLAEKIL